MTEHVCDLRYCREPARDAALCATHRDLLAQMLGDVAGLEDANAAGARWTALELPPAVAADGTKTPDPRVGTLKPGEVGRARSRFDAHPGLVAELAAAYARQTRSSENAGRRSVETPVPFDRKASAAARELHATLTRTARLVAEVKPAELPVREDSTSVSRWLLHHVDWLTNCADAAGVYADLESAVDAVRRVVFGRPLRIYAGPCTAVIEPLGEDGQPLVDRFGDALTYECGEDLVADPKAVKVSCRVCRTEWDVATRREFMLDAAEEWLAPIGVLASLLSEPPRTLPDGTVVAGREVTRDMLKGYKLRGRITAHGVDGDGHETFRVGEVRAVLAETWARQAEREARRGDGTGRSRSA